MEIKLTDYIRDIPDFPKEGILFKDVTPLLQNAKATEFALQSLLNGIKNQHIDKVVGIEARGFFFGPLLAQKLNAGFIPIRKPGKLPSDTFQEAYQLEYGEDRIEMHQDALQKGDRVLLHDDLLATGGTASAACRLIEKSGGHIVSCNFLVELDFLNGREKISEYPTHALIHY